ncbi:MAG: GntR family transcriptional regulator, partial [Thermoguttaceae bacterium]
MQHSHPSLPTPKYRRVYEHLRERIDQGMYQAGQRVPSEAQLVRRFDVSRTTVIRALRDLESAGMLQRRRGAGSFVAERPGATRGVGLAFFAPFIGPGQSLPYVEGLIHQHVARLAGEDHSRLRLQGLPEQDERPTDDLFHTAVDRLLES